MENCPDNLIYNTTDVYHPQLPYGEFICVHLFLFVLFMITCKNLFFFIYDHFWEFFLTCQNLFLSVCIYFFLFVCENLFLSVIISENLTLQQNSIRRNWMSEQLSGVLIHVTGTPPCLLRLVKVSSSSEL